MQHASSNNDTRGVVEFGTTVLTVNNRLARTIAAAHAQAMQARGHTAWQTPAVLPFSAFVIREWGLLHEGQSSADSGVESSTDGSGLPRLLSAAQCQVLWQRAVRESAADGLLSLSAAVSSASAARELLLRHQALLSAAACHEQIDALAFLRWHARYEALLRDGNWIDVVGATSALAAHVQAGSSPTLPARIRMSGFELVTAQQQTLLSAYHSVGVDIRHDAPPQASSELLRVEFSAPQDELQAMACWARALLDAGETGPIGIVLPDLETRLDAVEACFEDRLHPSPNVRMRPELAARVFNITLGRELLRMPVVASALASLQFLLPSVDSQCVGTVALSEYFADSTAERTQRLALDLRLRDAGARTIRMSHLARVARAERAIAVTANCRCY